MGDPLCLFQPHFILVQLIHCLFVTHQIEGCDQGFEHFSPFLHPSRRFAFRRLSSFRRFLPYQITLPTAHWIIGYFDLATPLSSIRGTISHVTLRRRVQQRLHRKSPPTVQALGTLKVPPFTAPVLSTLPSLICLKQMVSAQRTQSKTFHTASKLLSPEHVEFGSTTLAEIPKDID